MRDSERRRQKAVDRANRTHEVNRLIAPHLKELQDKDLAPPIPAGELKVLTFLEAGMDAYQQEVEPSVAQVIQEQVQAMKRWTPKRVMSYLLTLRDSPQDSTDLIPLLKKAENPERATYLLVETLQMQLESDPDLQLNLSPPPSRIPNLS